MERYVIVKPVQFRGRRYRIGDQVDGNIVRPDRAEALIRMKVIARVPETALESAAENSPEPSREPDQEIAREPDQETGVGATSDPGKAGRKKGVTKKEE